ncbi:hypothetical protein JQK15_02225 [Sphingobium sp. BHU LFT2]|uniref:DUF6161 domain-containing protein n=1 Tax=Sphingobium sp. BHU LFT2 TaxID=2807634 RepID=UPI001BE8A4AE|nr:DUF6161 domain-containing protein [Sphingobium sp. BHU LFT2]MBT2242343.1 hypothetical protein [Sphingobium sp. BHU LFT2]
MHIDFGSRNGAVRTFETAEDFFRKMGRASSQWKNIKPESKLSSEVISRLTDRLERFVADARSGVENAGTPSGERAISQAIRKHRPILADSTLGKAIIEALERENREEVLTLLGEGALRFSTGNTQVGGDRVETALNERMTASVKHLLPNIVHDLVRDPEAFLASINDANLKMLTVESALADLKEEQERILLSAETERQEFANRAAEMEAEWQNVLEAYNQRLQLTRTSTLWTNRAAAHKSNRKKLGWAAIAMAPVTFGLTIVSAYSFFHSAGYLMSARAQEFAWHRLLFASGATLIVLTLGLWATRIFVRLYMTEHHLAIDAEARAALGDTYIALTADGQAAMEDRKIVLATLFRPVSDGIVNDDAMPFLSPAAIASGLLSNDKGTGKP